MPTTVLATVKQNKASGLTCQVELERTSDSVSGTPAVAVSGYAEAEGAVVEEAVASSDFQATNKGGGGGGSPSLVRYATSARKLKPHYDKYFDEKGERKVRRFYQRYFTGVGVGGRLRFLTLTSSDYAVAQGYDIHKHFRALVMRLRRRWGCFQYMGVVEHKGGRKHLHLVFRGDYMAQVQLSAMWQDIHASPVVDIRAVWGSRGGAAELAKYLAKEVKNRYWASYNWVFTGWVGFSKRVKRAFGDYPRRGLLVAMARLDALPRYKLLDWWAARLNWQLPQLEPWLPSRRGLALA